ncbi:MAG: imidazole glycerol phosphate synthase subunit HisH [Candidatus Nanoarchaeia archaeon]|nr:imidazole glycerol phosphate synthase subunit HisH [Candidatus Nanoarchaeia archaeon]
MDYGLNNLKSLRKALEKIGKKVKIISTPEEIMNAKYLILPGVGAFGDGMRRIREMNLEEPIRKKIKEGTPLLGICLGMQLLFSESEEFGIHKGLDLIEGRVIKLKPSENGNTRYKIPHIGWNKLRAPSFNNPVWSSSLLNNTEEQDEFYFVHSYHPVPSNQDYVIATTEYGNQEFCSVVKKDNITGVQFHPEKSGECGLKILENFCFNVESKIKVKVK